MIEIKNIFNGLNDRDNLNKKIIDIANSYHSSLLLEHRVYNMNDFNEVLKDKTPYEIAKMTNNDYFNANDDYFEIIDNRIETRTSEECKDILVNKYWDINQKIINMLIKSIFEED